MKSTVDLLGTNFYVFYFPEDKQYPFFIFVILFAVVSRQAQQQTALFISVIRRLLCAILARILLNATILNHFYIHYDETKFLLWPFEKLPWLRSKK